MSIKFNTILHMIMGNFCTDVLVNSQQYYTVCVYFLIFN